MSRVRSTKDRRPWFSFYAADWLADENVMAMTLAERGAYITLLAIQWREGSVPAAPSKLCRILGVSEEEYAEQFSPFVGALFCERDGRLYNDRLERERLAAESRMELAAVGGAARAEKATRNSNGQYSQSSGTASQQPATTQPSQSQSQSQTQSEEEKLTSPPAPVRAPRETFDLEAIYAAYPRKGDGKGKGLERLERQIRNRETYEQALQAARFYAEKVQAEQTPLKFVKQFVTWCNGHWRDYVDGPHIVAQNDRKNFREPMAHVAKTTEEEL